MKQLSKRIVKDELKANSLVKNLSQRNYENKTEIKAVFRCEQKKLKYHRLILKDVLITKDNKTKKTVDRARILLEKNQEKIEDEEKNLDVLS